MKKNIYFLATLLSCSLTFSACSNEDSNETSDKNINQDQSSQVEVISPDYITSDDQESSEVIATIYVSDVESDSIVDKKVKVKEITSECLLDELKNENIITSETTNNEFTTYEDSDEELIGVLNLSKEFYDFNLGSGFEYMMINSVAKTYIENFNLDKFKILVDGEEYESGNKSIDKDEYFTKDSLK